MILLALILLNSFVIEGCLNGNFQNELLRSKGNEPSPRVKPDKSVEKYESELEKYFGRSGQLNQFNSALYEGLGGGPVERASDLRCQEFDDSCCWRNDQAPLDQLEFAQASGFANPDIFQRFFGTRNMPKGNYLVSASQTGEKNDVKAVFRSCAVLCSEETSLSFNHWMTPGVRLEVCTSQYGSNRLMNCQEVERIQSPGPTTFYFPPSEISQYIIKADSFQNPGMVIIDDIQADFIPCRERTPRPSPDPFGPETQRPRPEPVTRQPRPEPVTRQPRPEPRTRRPRPEPRTRRPRPEPVTRQPRPEPRTRRPRPEPMTRRPTRRPRPRPPPVSPSSICQNVACDFERGPCGYQSPRAGTRQFETAQIPFGNFISGITKKASGEKFLAAFLKNREKAAISSDIPGGFVDPTTIHFTFFEATDGIQLKGCCDTEDNCPFSSDSNVSRNHLDWDPNGSFNCPAGTRKIIFVCENRSRHQGACGVDAIQLRDPKRPNLNICNNVLLQ